MDTWSYSATSTGGLLTGTSPSVTPTPDGHGGSDLVLDLADSVFIGGFSGTIDLTLTPPTTAANGTNWSLTPELTDSLGTVSDPEPSDRLRRCASRLDIRDAC